MSLTEKYQKGLAIKKGQGVCPFCGKKVNSKEEFKDEVSWREYTISGLCQECQNEVFQEE